MVCAADLKDLALVPVRGTVYVVKLPIVLVWMVLGYICALVYSIIAKIVSIPVSYFRRAARRIRLTWNWTKSSAKSFIPWKSSSSNIGAQREICPPRTVTRLAYDERADLEDMLYESDHRLAARGAHRRGRRSRKMAIISSLIRILMEPGSPVESEEENEIVCRSDDEGEDKVYRLIRDLVQFSRSETGSRASHRNSHSCGQGLDLETLRRHAKDKDKLQALICDLDQYVKDMDSEAGAVQRSHAPSQDIEYEDRELLTPTTISSNGGDTDLYMDASEGEGQLSGEESEENYGAKFDEACSNLRPDPPPEVCRGLSPVAEVSPEIGSIGSTESLERNCVDLESELNTAMLRLTALTGELAQVEESGGVAIASGPEARSEVANTRKTDDSSIEDEFAVIPKTSPTLGLKAGHSRRNLATARKIRPPSLAKDNQQLLSDGVEDSGGTVHAPLSKEDSQEFEDEDSEYYSSDEGEDVNCEERRVTQVPLSDQLKLLTPTFQRHNTDPLISSEATAALYSTVNKTSKSSRAKSVGDDSSTPEHQSDLNRTRSFSMTGSGNTEQEKTSATPERSLFMHNLTPPWKQIRSHNSSTASSTGSPLDNKQATPPPPLPHRALTPTHIPPAATSASAQDPVSASPDLYDKLPPIPPAPLIPSRAGEEGLYDIIPGQRLPYLHERLAAGDKRKEQSRATPPITWTPQLPPRNSKLKRTSSAEAVSAPKDHTVLVRRGSERRASSSSVRSEPSSSSRRTQSSSLDREQDRRVRRDRSSSEKHHHHHHHSHSSERPSSGKHRSSSEKHRSSEKKTPPSSKSKHGSEGGGGSLWKILTSPSSSKSKSSSSSPSSKKSGREERDRERRRSSDKEERDRRREKERKHSSSSRSTRHDSSKSRTRAVAQREEDMPQNESSSSLRSGVSTLSSDSSGRESLV